MMAWSRLHETHHNRTVSAGFLRLARNCAALMRQPVFMGYALNSAFGSGVFFSFLAGAPFIMTGVMGRTPAEYGVYFILVSLGYMFGNFLSGRFAERAGIVRMIATGSAISLCGLAFLVVLTALGIQEPYAIFAPMCVVAVSNGLTIPSATSGAISVRPDISGSASGLSGFFQIGVGALASLAVGLLHDGTRLPMVKMMVASGLIAILFLGLTLWANKRSAT